MVQYRAAINYGSTWLILFNFNSQRAMQRTLYTPPHQEIDNLYNPE